MCNSVLCGHLARAAHLHDLNEQGGADVGKVLVAQILPWCGVHTKRMKELKSKMRDQFSASWAIHGVVVHEQDTGPFGQGRVYQRSQRSRNPWRRESEHGLLAVSAKSPCSLSARGFYVVDTLRNNHYPKRRWDHTSVMEGKVQDDTSNGNFKHQCPEKFMNTYMKECNKS